MRPRPPGVRTYLLGAMGVMAVVSVAVTGMLSRAGIAGELAESDTTLTKDLQACILRAVGEAGAISAGILLVLALVLSHHMSRPLRRLNELASRIAGGTIDKPSMAVGGGRELAQLGTTLERLAGTLRLQDEMRRATAADVTHELRGLVGNLVGRIHAVQDGVIQSGPGLRHMEVDVRRLERIADDLGQLAEAQRPGLLVVKHRIDLATVVRDRVSAFADLYAARAITVEPAIRSVWMDGDPGRLAQVVDNLLSNACRYTDPGGRVTVRVRRHGLEAVIVVADSGMGIAPEHLRRVFDRFWRAPAARDRVSAGSGIGLALVRDLAVAHGGRVDVSSQLGRGTQFTVSLPTDVADRLGPPLRPTPQLDAPGDAPVVWKLYGDVDITNADTVEQQLLAHVSAHGADLVLDLSEVGFFGSSGLALLRSADAAVRRAGGQLLVVEVPPHVLRLFDLAGFTVGRADAVPAPLAGLTR